MDRMGSSSPITAAGLYGAAALMLLFGLGTLAPAALSFSPNAAGWFGALALGVVGLVLLLTGLGILRRRLWAVLTAWVFVCIGLALGMDVFFPKNAQLSAGLILLYAIVLGSLLLVGYRAIV